jgi:hypothetical protein
MRFGTSTEQEEDVVGAGVFPCDTISHMNKTIG